MSTKNSRKANTSDPGSENSSENEGPFSQNSKRQKLDAGGASSSSTTQQQLMLAGRLKSGEDGYVDGSIVRVTLKNFVTYEACEFRPGPHLNMIVGPNGTGKSTAVCAMALGLGGNTSLLGRAKDISEFVKTGKDNASIEIELKHRGRGGNIVIKRQIKKAKNNSIWQINGQQTTHKEVLAKVNSLNIQVDNLCQFLPQDKVCEFAQMTPPELLRETQKAAGDKELSLWHEQLIVKRTEQRTLQSSVRGDTDALTTLESRTAVLERDWVRFQEREKILKKVKLLESGIYLARYGQAKDDYDVAKKSRMTAFSELKRLEKSNAPVEELRSQLKATLEEATAGKKRLSEQFSRKQDQIKEKNASIELSENECDEIKHKIETLKRREKQRREKMAALRHEVEDLENRFSGEPPSADVSAVQPNIDAISLQIRDGTQRVQDLQAQQGDIMDEGKELYQQINQKVKQLEDLKNIRTRRLNLLEKIDLNCHKAAHWLENNQHRFEKHIFGPVCLEINVRDQQYVDAIEFSFGGVGSNEMKMFVCQTQQDYNLFTTELIDRMKLRVPVTWLQRTLEHYRVPMNIEQLRHKYGLDHYILDLIDGPPPVLCFLCESKGVNRLPLTLRDSDSKRIADNSEFHKFIIKDESFNIKKSEYGARNRFVTVMKVSRATMLTDSVDINVQRTLQTDLDRAREKLSQNEGRMKALKEEESKCRRTDEELRTQREALNKNKKEIQAARTQWERNKLKLEAKRQQLEDDFNRPNVSGQEEANLKRTLHGHAVKRGRFALEYKNLIQENVELFAQRNFAYLQYIQAFAELKALETRCREKDAELEQANADLQRADAAFKKAKEHAKRCLDEATRVSEEMDDETKEEWRTLSIGRTLEQIEEEIALEKAKADAKYATNPRVLEDYNRRKKETDQLRSRLASTEKHLEKLTNDINIIKLKWQPRLQQLVDRISQGFSTAFDRIGCAGEVRISEHEDYDKWGIDILVKFRDNEKLQILTGQRQSGGERSVSTILYLMALQELARAPFRVVDEINQGMDPRNERLIHSQLVEVACRPNTPQYFLITPKLLPDLDYHERMRVLCIFNGEYQPEKLKLRSYIDIQKRRMVQ